MKDMKFLDLLRNMLPFFKQPQNIPKNEVTESKLRTGSKHIGHCTRCGRNNINVRTAVVVTSNQIGLIDVCDECYAKRDEQIEEDL